MHDNRTHPLLEQVPLIVSPFVKLPTATTLPYTYKPMPSTLPPSATGIAAAAAAPSSTDANPANTTTNKPKYVVSSSGHAAHPDDIMASCRALQAHIAKLQAEAEAELRAIDERIRARELAEKRRLAPGWLDSEARLLEPERKGAAATATSGTAAGGDGTQQIEGRRQEDLQFAGSGSGFGRDGHGPGGASEMAVPDEGEELDRAFGTLGLGR
ncbi:hypothetical protein B0T17DRAFT_517380 [Bombardia bombarda]|uniref:Uncharacterized protein n=1 Tax=Bombardia bombarda TaxID=252184 RepID=A0AA39XKZ2_9PEZI|nr:hypothetical protein B0T17DRAFT_517380 [Bombardia bombarda]